MCHPRSVDTEESELGHRKTLGKLQLCDEGETWCSLDRLDTKREAGIPKCFKSPGAPPLLLQRPFSLGSVAISRLRMTSKGRRKYFEFL